MRSAAVQVMRLAPWRPEFWAGLAAVLWGLWAWLAPLSLDVRGVFPAATWMMPEECWQGAMILLGLAQFAVLRWRLDAAQRWVAAIGTFLWTVLLLSLFQRQPSAPSNALYVVMAGINFASLVRFPNRSPGPR